MPYDIPWSTQLRKIYEPKYLSATNEIDAMAEACLKAHAAIQTHGTPEMVATMRILLFQIGQQIAFRQNEKGEEGSGR